MALSAVHFKFKSQTSYATVQFDGPFVSVGELKGLVAEKAGMGGAAARDLVLADPRTGEEYADDAALIPKSTSVLVRRAPAGGGAALTEAAEEVHVLPAPRRAVARPVPLPRSMTGAAPGGRDARPVETTFFNPYTLREGAGTVDPGELPDEEGAAGAGAGPAYNEEDAALRSMLDAQGSSWRREVADAARAGRGRGRGRDGGDGRGRGAGRGGRGGLPFAEPGAKPPSHYVCRRCNSTGHFMTDCPTQVWWRRGGRETRCGLTRPGRRRPGGGVAWRVGAAAAAH
jgi:E3 ubiquitin-protein ligase RBBP6